MAVDGTTSPAHQHTEARTVKSESRNSCSPDEAIIPSDNEISVDIKPNFSPLAQCDERHQTAKGKLPGMSSLPAENGSYYFGESHVTRLESFVESMTGPSFPPHPSSRIDTQWSSPMEKPPGCTSVTSRKPTSSSGLVSSVSSNHNQPLDLSVKSSSQSRRALNESPVSFRRSENRMKTSDMSSTMATVDMATAAGGGAVAGFPASAYPTIADMWLAHWLNMATVASNMFPHLPLNLPANHHLMSALSPPLGIQTNLQHQFSSDRRAASPYLKSSMMNSPKSSSTSSLLSCPTPVKVGTAVSPTTCLQDGAVNTSSSHSNRRRRHDVMSDVTSSHQSTSAFSMFHRSGDRKDNSTVDGGRSRGSTVAALSAIESFVENSFSRDNKKNVTTTALLSKRYDSPGSMPAAVKRCRRLGDDHMTSSGDEDTGSCDGASRARGFSSKRRRQQQQRKPEAAHQRHSGGENNLESKPTENCFTSMRQTPTPVENTSSSVDYLPCLTYDRPANTKHPLECLERLVHVQSNVRRSEHVQQVGVTSPSSPSSTSHGRNHNEAVTPSRGATDALSETVDGGDNRVTCSSSVDDVAETTRKVNDVTTALPVDTFRNPTTASLVCCNM